MLVVYAQVEGLLKVTGSHVGYTVNVESRKRCKMESLLQGTSRK